MSGKEVKIKGQGMKDRAVFMFLRHNLGIMLVLLLLVVLLSALSPVFLTPNNLLTVLKQISHNMCLALGMTLVIILGGIDLSVGALVAMIGTVTVGLIVNQGVPIFVGILMGLFLGIICGAINGGFVAFFKFPAFIVTLSMMNIARGVAYIYCGGKTTRIMDERFVKIGTGSLGLVPVPVIYMLVMIVIFSILLNKTKFGTYIYAIGGNREAARLSGVPIKLTEIAVFTIAGFMASFAGIVLAARMYSGQPSVGDGHELNAIAACVLGGISMSGGVGRIGRTVMGVLVMGVINNGLNLLNVSTYWQYVAKGAIILIAVMVDWMKQRSKVKV